MISLVSNYIICSKATYDLVFVDDTFPFLKSSVFNFRIVELKMTLLTLHVRRYRDVGKYYKSIVV